MNDRFQRFDPVQSLIACNIRVDDLETKSLNGCGASRPSPLRGIRYEVLTGVFFCLTDTILNNFGCAPETELPRTSIAAAGGSERLGVREISGDGAGEAAGERGGDFGGADRLG